MALIPHQIDVDLAITGLAEHVLPVGSALGDMVGIAGPGETVTVEKLGVAGEISGSVGPLRKN